MSIPAKQTFFRASSVLARIALALRLVFGAFAQALAGHRLCETTSSQVAVNGVTAGDASGITITTGLGNKLAINFLGQESYHPNVLGHELIEQAILQKTHNFTLPSVASPLANLPAASDGQGVLKAPKSGRATKLTINDNTVLTNRIVAKDSQVQIKASGRNTALNQRLTTA